MRRVELNREQLAVIAEHAVADLPPECGQFGEQPLYVGEAGRLQASASSRELST